MNLIQQASEQMREILLNAMGALVASGAAEAQPLPPFTVEVPADVSHGDFASNIAMVSARTLKMAPRKIAEDLCAHVVLEGSPFERFEIAGPGFINFFLGRQWFASVPQTVLEEGGSYGRTDTNAGKKVIVEFVSANPTGPMHIGNARGGAVGDCLASVLDWSGWTVHREFYVNDAGNQIEKFALSLEIRYLQLYQDGVELPEEAYHGEDIVNHAKNFAAKYGDQYVGASSEDRRKALVAYALPLNIEGLERDLRTYRIEYDNWFRESALHESGGVKEIIEQFKNKGVTYEQDGALWFKAEQFGAEKDFVLVRSNGIPTYVVPDIVYHYNKLSVRGFDKAIDVLGADHHGYLPRLKAALKALDVDPTRLDFVLMQMVRLVRNGETVKLSKRSGKAITLSTLLEEIPIDAARFFFNLREASSQFDFDLDLAIEQSNKNPVYYVQYAHARICSILRNLEEEGIYAKAETTAADFAPLTLPEEIDVIRHLSALPVEIDAAAAQYDPARITRYSLDLAAKFHKFYAACRVKGEEESILQARLGLCRAVKTVLENCSAILKINCPDSM